MRISARHLVLLAALAAAGCGSAPVTTRINDSYDPTVHKRLAVLPFDSKYADGRSMSDAIVTGLMADGFSVADRDSLGGVDLSDADQALAPDQLAKLKSASVDGIVFGSIDSMKTGEINAVSLRMVDTRNGSIIFSSTFKNEKQLDANQIPQVITDDIGKELKRLYKRRLKAWKRQQKLAQRAQRKTT